MRVIFLNPNFSGKFRDYVLKLFTRKKGAKLAGETLDHDFYGTSLAMKRHVATWYDYQKILNAMGGSLLTPEGKVARFFGEYKGAGV